MAKIFLHSDLNNFFASVECLYDPSLRDKPVAVCGNPEARHGIVLAKNMLAKKKGVKTGEALWQAKEKCRDIVFVKPHYDRYLKFSELAQEIYKEYTDLIYPYGIDEAWLDVTSSTGLFGSGEKMANEIRERIKYELGITVSVGVSYNKVFAKLGSDMKKPDATTVITKENFMKKVWPLPVSDLLFVGSSTKRKLNLYSIKTIGDLATCDTKLLLSLLGKNGIMLQNFANGHEYADDVPHLQEPPIRSIGNSTTTPRDLITDDDVRIVLYVLCESVASRMRDHDFACRTVQIYIRNKDLRSCLRQGPLDFPTQNSYMLFDKAFSLYKQHHNGDPIRSIGVRACNLFVQSHVQLSFYPDVAQNERRYQLECAIDKIRNRFGRNILTRGVMLTQRKLSSFDPTSNTFGGKVSTHEG